MMRLLALLALFLIAGLALPPAAISEEKLPPEVAAEADKTLKAMSEYMGALPSFFVKYDIESEIISTAGEKLQFSSSGQLVVRRPDRTHVVRDTGFSSGQLFIDGRTVSILSPTKNAYLQFEGPGTIEETMDSLRDEYGLDIPAADLLDAKPYDALVKGLKSGTYHGIAMVGGVAAHHLAFRTDEIDWQIWIRTGPAPLPLKFVITTKWMTAAPQYSIRFRDWQTGVETTDGTFRFQPPTDAVRWKSVVINELGEIASGEE
jgi:hypothetical protein